MSDTEPGLDASDDTGPMTSPSLCSRCGYPLPASEDLCQRLQPLYSRGPLSDPIWVECYAINAVAVQLTLP